MELESGAHVVSFPTPNPRGWSLGTRLGGWGYRTKGRCMHVCLYTHALKGQRATCGLSNYFGNTAEFNVVQTRSSRYMGPVRGTQFSAVMDYQGPAPFASIDIKRNHPATINLILRFERLQNEFPSLAYFHCCFQCI